MDRFGIFVSLVLTIVLAQMCDSQKDFAGGRHEGAGARDVWDQERARARNQGHSTGGIGDDSSARQPTESSYRTHNNNSRSGRGTEQLKSALSQQESRHATVVETGSPVTPQKTDASYKEWDSTVPSDSTRITPNQRTASNPSQQRHRITTRQNPTGSGNKPRTTSLRRLVGPNVCGGQQCCSGWAVAPGTNRCIKPDCQPPCQNRGSCSRPHTCVCRSGFQGAHCEEVAPEQVYIRTGASRALMPVRPGGGGSGGAQQQRRRPGGGSTRTQTPRPQAPVTRRPLATASQVRRGSADSSPQQTGMSRTVKRYPSSNWPITSNALPNGNGNRHHSDQRLTVDRQGGDNLNNAVAPIGANGTSSLDRIKIVFTPMVCRRTCSGGRCFNSCEKGDTTTVYSENQNQNQQPKPQGFRLFFCQLPCMNGGRCIGRDQCWCPSNSTGKFCHLPAPPPQKPQPAQKEVAQPGHNSHSMYTLPLSNQQASMHPSLVNVHIQHPPEAEVQIHQVARVKPGQMPPAGRDTSADGVHSVQQRSQPGNGNGNGNGSGKGIDNGNGNGNGHTRPHSRQNGYVGRCFQETIDGQCGKPLPGLTKQDDCCGSVGASWGLNKCTECPPKPAYAVIANGQVECPKGYKRMNLTHCQDINECLMPGICKNAECLNTKGSYRCTCKPGYMLDAARSHCVSDKAVSDKRGVCYRSTSAGTCFLPLTQHITKQICCCSRVGKAWGPACERCPVPDTDHFKEICPAGHGYTYSRSDIQISLRQVEEEELRRTDESQHPLPPPHHHRPQQPQIPQYPSFIHPDTEPPRTPIWQPEDVEILRTPAAVTDSPSRNQDVLERTTPHYTINLKPEPEGRDTTSINVVTQVTDVDRCSITPTICGPGVCVPVQTGYTCHCHPGYQLNALQTKCLDVNECDSDPCGGKGHCLNSLGSYTCHCYTGYSQVITQNKRFCQDVNECDMPNKCPGSRCINTEGSYTCECESGYAKSWRGQCEDIDECRKPNACPEGRCLNTPGSFQCLACGPGFKAAGGRCLDVNECQMPGVCAHGRCVNMEGSYTCICNAGYQASPDNNSCQDEDECQLPGVCHQGRCVNLEGTYRCSCNLGYQASQDGTLCEDIDECTTRNVCPYGICTNTEGSYSCSHCRPGYVRSANGQRCEDVDECAQGTVCPGGVCTNTEGSFTCEQCQRGYRLSQDKRRCEDVDECLTPSVCHNGICLNAEGSYSCVPCPSGYIVSADGELCEDIDECTSVTTCPTGTCINTEGSFRCITCGPGFRMAEDGQCEDEDECAQPGVCPGGVCRNTAGSFSCMACGTGFRVSADGSVCEDVDECLVANVCPGRLCRNSAGSFSCSSCGPGYALSEDGYGCEDIDECLSPGVCPSGVCTNTEGSYSCVFCDAGYTLSADRQTCDAVEGATAGQEISLALPRPPSLSDVDECADGNTCSGGQCLNTDGSFHCVCEAGFKFHPETGQCKDRDECKEYGSSVCGSWHCENTLGSYRCFMGCQPGFHGQDAGDCDIDECVNETICGDHGFCENTDGSYRCQCDLGYTDSPDGPGCVDINECEMSTALCGQFLCENVEGTFLCICPNENEEYIPATGQCLSRSGMMDPIDDPELAPGPSDDEERKQCYYNINDANFCDNVLSRNVTKQECCCTVGAGWGDNCEIHPCPFPGRAEFSQLCPHGRGLLPLRGPSQGFGQQLFKDADECEMFGPEICETGRCSNSYSTYSCFCRTGYYYDTVRLECVDHDECLAENTCVDGSCFNTAGSFNCFCSPPMILDHTRRRCVAVNGSEESHDPDEDYHVDICWQGLTGDNMCSDPLVTKRTTYTECCCLFGVAWGSQCAFCPERSSNDYASLCNLPRRILEDTDSLRERPGYEYGPDGSEGPDGALYWGGYVPGGRGSYYNTPGSEYGPQDPQPGSFYPGPDSSDDYGSREAARSPVLRPREFQPHLVDPYSERYDGFEGLQAEECGVLNGCENGRCVRVREGYTCDCFDGYELNLAKMACIDIDECKDIGDKVPLCKNGACANTEGSYRCTCLPGFQASARPHECIPEAPASSQREAGK
ncbi:latent-transforming growth factor beta-binding protein 2-like [Anguilla rostrata]|uniref:latent-transforming growth factor beta-binding protein 2-like n=1 Tax=Anguilla rostrata TaxID=7938 RepID=UPI0030CDA056